MTRRATPWFGVAGLAVALLGCGCGPQTAQDGGSDTDACEELPPLQILDEEFGLPFPSDLDGDGSPDLFMLAPNMDEAASSSVLWGRGDGAFEVGAGPVFSETSPSTLALGDLDGDGRAEVVLVAGSPEGEPEAAHLEVAAFGDGRDFEPPTLLELDGPRPYPTTMADLDGDGRDELVGATQDEFSRMVAIYGSGATFDTLVEGPPIDLPWTGVRSVVAADLDGDGDDEVVVFGGDNFGIADGEPAVVVTDADDSGALVPIAEHVVGTDPGPPLADMQAADFDGDGLVDISVMNLQNLSILRGRGDGTLEPHVLVSFPEWVELAEGCETCSMMRGARAGDFDGDGVAELAVSVGPLAEEQFMVIDDVLGEAPTLVPLVAWGDTVADFDGDGCDDIINVVRTESLFEMSSEMTLYRCPMLACAPE